MVGSLPGCCERAPTGHSSAAEERDELAAPYHSITSSAMASRPGGKVRLSSFAAGNHLVGAHKQ